MRIEVCRASEDLGCDLIFLERNAWMFNGVLAEVAEQLAKRFGTMKGMAVDQPLDFDEARFRAGYMACYTHGNREYQSDFATCKPETYGL
jgi:hypothetical protein